MISNVMLNQNLFASSLLLLVPLHHGLYRGFVARRCLSLLDVQLIFPVQWHNWLVFFFFFCFLPSTGVKTRFKSFLDRVPALVKNVKLEKVKQKSRTGLIMSCLILATTPAIILVAVMLSKLNFGIYGLALVCCHQLL